MGLIRRVEALEVQHRSHFRPIVAELPDGTRYLLVGPRICVAPARPKGTVAEWQARQPGAWRRVRRHDLIDGAKLYRVNSLAVFTKAIPMAGGRPVETLSIDLDKLDQSRLAVPIARSRD